MPKRLMKVGVVVCSTNSGMLSFFPCAATKFGARRHPNGDIHHNENETLWLMKLSWEQQPMASVVLKF
jgi:hypothetical protein